MEETVIPLIDMSRLDDPDMLARLDLACRDWGFFYLTNHGISSEDEELLLQTVSEFFAMPSQEKLKIRRSEDNPWGFYDTELTKNRLDWKEIFDYGPADGDKLLPRWPQALPMFREAVQNYYDDCQQISFRLLGAVSKNLGLPETFLDYLFDPEHTSFVRLNHYPVCPEPESPVDIAVPISGYQGINHHTDAGAITILMQDNQAGLEIYHEGEWHLVPPLPGALVVNIGDIVQVWSNDRYQAALHRVRANAEHKRFSMPFFFNPAYEANYAPLVADEAAACYESINWGEFRSARAAGDYSDIGEEVQISQFRKTAFRQSD